MNTQKANILVVDDNPLNLKLLGGILSKQKYRIQPAVNGSNALTSARIKQPDLILLDIMLPDMSGYEVCESLKSDHQTFGIPVIFVSILNNVDDKLRAFSSGGVDYITKPFHKDEILARVDAQICLRKLQKCLEAKNEQLRKEVIERKRAEDALKKAYKEMEKQVKKRTADIVDANDALKDINTALNVLLNKREKDKDNLEENVLYNIKESVLPYIGRLKNSGLTKNQAALVSIMESNLQTVTSPLIRRLSSPYLNLTPTEIRVAHFVKDGMRNKEIAGFLNLSVGTILTHRHSIRRKLGLVNRKTNLRAYLLSFEEACSYSNL